jgi:hypothetical protein
MSRLCRLFFTIVFTGLVCNAISQVTPIDYNDPNNWAVNQHLNKYLSLDPSYTIVHPDTTQHTIVNVPYDTLSDFDIFFVYPTQPGSSGLIGPGLINSNWNTPDSIDPIIQMQATFYGVFGRIYAPYYRQVNLATFTSFTVSMEDQARLLDTANTDVIASFEHYMNNYNNGKRVILVGHSQGSIMIAGMLRKFEADPGQYQAYMDKIFLSVLPGYSGPWVQQGQVAGGWTQNYPICQYPLDTACIMTWQSYRHTFNIQTVLPYHHVHNDSLVSMGYRYQDFDTLVHEVLLDSLGYSTVKPIPLMIFPNANPDFGLQYSNVTTDFAAYENMYNAYYESSSSGAGLKLQYIFTLGDDRKKPFPFLLSDFHSFDHSCFTGDVIDLIWQKINQIPTGIEEEQGSFTYRIYPNPATEQVTFEASDKMFQTQSIEVYSATGKLMEKKSETSTKTILNTSSWPAGIYFYHILTDEENSIAKGKFVIR